MSLHADGGPLKPGHPQIDYGSLYGFLPNGRPFLPGHGQVGTWAQQERLINTTRPLPTAAQIADAELRRRVRMLELAVFGMGERS